MEKVKNVSLVSISTAVLLGLNSAAVSAMGPTFDELMQYVKDGCPTLWEDPATPLPSDINAVNTTTLFADDGQDKQSFETLYRSTNEVVDRDTGAILDPVTTEEMLATFASAKAIAFECNAHRKNLFVKMLSTNETDAQSALDAAIGVANAVDFTSRQWRVGDIRVTGRAVADDGWLFPTGQTIGAVNSGADLADDMYEQLFERAKAWHPNTGSEVWGTNTVTLPDMRGRAVYGADNLGGASRDTLVHANADKIGGYFGRERNAITVANLPTHNHAVGLGGTHGHTANSGGVHKHTNTAIGNHGHTLSTTGNHSHPVGIAGQHGHALKTSVFTGSSTGRSDYPYFEGKARPNYQNSIPSSIQQAGNHAHSITAAGNHKHVAAAAGTHNHAMANSAAHAHTVSAVGNHSHASANVGSSAALDTMSPGITFNVEIKY